MPGIMEDEAAVPRPFIGTTGREFDRTWLPLAALRRYEVRVTNLVPVHAYNDRDATKDELKFFEHFILEEIERTRPEFIVPMGIFCVRYFLNPSADLTTVHGLVHTSKRFPDSKILPIFHPAAGLHNPENLPVIAYDFEQVKLALLGLLPDRPRDEVTHPEYVELKTARDVENALYCNDSLFMGADSEGYLHNAWGLSFSLQEGISYVIRAASKTALAAFAKWVDAHPEVTVILHNALHDLPIYREMGINLRNYCDTMVLSYCLGLEPQGLKDLGYRHTGTRMLHYEEVVMPSVRKATSEYLFKVASGDWGVDKPVPEMSEQVVTYRQPTRLHKRARRALDDIFGRYTGVIYGPKRGGSVKLKELGVSVGKVSKESAANLPKDLNAWKVQVSLVVKPELDKCADFICDLAESVPPEDPPDPVKRWKSAQEDCDESLARCEAVIGTLPVTGLDTLPDQDVAIRYSAKDADITRRVYFHLQKKVEANSLAVLASIDNRCIPYVDLMKSTGIKVNTSSMIAFGAVLREKMREIQEKIHSDIGEWINPSSSKQVSLLIYEILKFPVESRTETGQPSTNDKVLEALSTLHPSIKDVTDYREVHKLASTYCDKLTRWVDAEDRIHCNWKMTRVVTGRFATSEPNLLAIPVRSQLGNEIRKRFVPREGYAFVGADLSQVEVRCAAHFSGDTNLITIFNTPGADFHNKTAAFAHKCTEQEIIDDNKKFGGASKRSSMKNVSFGVLYGIGAQGLRSQLKSKCHTDWTEEQAQEMIDLWLNTAYPGVKGYMERQKALCRRHGYVQSMFGRKRFLPGIGSSVARIRAESERQAINFPIQATATEAIKLAMINIWNRVLPSFWKRGIDAKPTLCVHDELQYEVPVEAAEELKQAIVFEMENAVELCVPVVADGKISVESWAGLK